METLEMNTEISSDESLSDTKCEDNSCEELIASEEGASQNKTDEEVHENEEAYVAVDYGEVEKQDLEELHALFPHLKNKTSITELDNPLRYAALRDLGLSPKEAYLATSDFHQSYDNRSHLRSSVPKSASAPQNILSRGELEAARELFSGLSDREIQKLYKKVSR